MVSKGRYTVPGLDDAWREAHRLHGVVSGRSAAQFWELDLKLSPGETVVPVVTVPNKRHVDPSRRVGADVKFRDLPPGGVLTQPLPTEPGAVGYVTTVVQTVLDCCRDLTEVEALCVVDAALRRGVRRDVLLESADALSRQVRGRVRRVVELGDGRSANAFESCLRHAGLSVPGLDLEPQVQIGPHRVDLADRVLRIVVEAESYAFHGSKEMFRHDTRRYTALVIDDWMVLRFVWEDVVLRPEVVQRDLTRAVALRRERLGVQSDR